MQVAVERRHIGIITSNDNDPKPIVDLKVVHRVEFRLDISGLAGRLGPNDDPDPARREGLVDLRDMAVARS